MIPGLGALIQGVSTCLLGKHMRNQDGHQLDRYLVQTLGRYVDFVPVRPELQAGFPTPRELVRLTGDPECPRLVTGKTGIAHAERMLRNHV